MSKSEFLERDCKHYYPKNKRYGYCDGWCYEVYGLSHYVCDWFQLREDYKKEE